MFVHRDGSKPVSFRCSMSIGISCFPEDARGQQELIDHADQALYSSKENGRDRTSCYLDRKTTSPGRRGVDVTAREPGRPG